MIPSLLDIAVHCLAQQLARCSPTPAASGLVHLPEPELALRVWMAYEELQRVAGSHEQPAQRLAVLQALSPAWQPRRLALTVPAAGAGPLQQVLHLVSERLSHLQLAPPPSADVKAVTSLTGLAWLQGLRSPQQLTCLSLAGCQQLCASEWPALLRLQNLQALDLSCTSVGDEAAAVLAQLPRLAVLNLSETRVSNVTLDALTYGVRLQAWTAAAAAGQPDQHNAEEAARAWPPLLVLHHLQLARTCVTAAGVRHLAHLPRLSFLDVRGTSVGRAVQAALAEQQPGLRLIQYGVLTRSAAVAAAVLNQHGALVCGCPCSSRVGGKATVGATGGSRSRPGPYTSAGRKPREKKPAAEPAQTDEAECCQALLAILCVCGSTQQAGS